MNPNINISTSLLDVMKDGREFESLISYQYNNLNIVGEIRRSINEIKATRHNPVLCYIANVVHNNINNSFDGTDDLPFNEMVAEIVPHFSDAELPQFGKNNLWFL